jgi:hypothetical protein
LVLTCGMVAVAAMLWVDVSIRGLTMGRERRSEGRVAAAEPPVQPRRGGGIDLCQLLQLLLRLLVDHAPPTVRRPQPCVDCLQLQLQLQLQLKLQLQATHKHTHPDSVQVSSTHRGCNCYFESHL